MGHPKKQRKKFARPKRPYDKERIEKEKQIVKEFGLRRKHEIWKAQSLLRNYQKTAKDLQAKRDEKKEKILFGKLNKLGLKCSSLEEVLDLNTENILGRRLQTIVFKKGLSSTIKQARQGIVHGHVKIAGRKISWPGYIVQPSQENDIEAAPFLIRVEEKKADKNDKG